MVGTPDSDRRSTAAFVAQNQKKPKVEGPIALAAGALKRRNVPAAKAEGNVPKGDGVPPPYKPQVPPDLSSVFLDEDIVPGAGRPTKG